MEGEHSDLAPFVNFAVNCIETNSTVTFAENYFGSAVVRTTGSFDSRLSDNFRSGRDPNHARGSGKSGDNGFLRGWRPYYAFSIGCIIELEKGNGTRMRICVHDGAAVDWSRMKEAFLGA